MKKVTRILGLCALVALATVSCRKDDNNAPQGSKSFLATINQPTDGAKTHIGEWDGQQNYLLWNAGDAINVYAAEGGDPSVFTTNDANAPEATFTGDIDESAVYYACYPKENTIDAEGQATLSLTADQTYATEGLISNGVYPMAAVNEGKNFEFHSPCGVLHLALKGNATVSSIVVTAAEDIAGDITVDVNAPTTVNGIANGQKTITLTCPEEGVTLDPEIAKDFYIVAAAGAFAQGFTAVVNDMGGHVIHELKTTQDNTLLAENILTMPFQVIEYDAPTVTIDATGCLECNETYSGTVTVINEQECEYGVVYAKKSENAIPTLGGDNCTTVTVNTETLAANTPKDFSIDLSGESLDDDSEYVVRAYASVFGVIGYSDVVVYDFPREHVYTYKPFTIGSNQTVYFSKGNLQYIGTSGTWQFAGRQYEILGSSNGSTAVTANRDLFGWGTSGHDNGNVYYQPYNTESTGQALNGYGYGPKDNGYYNHSLTDDYADSDWGVNMSGVEGRNWRTLTGTEARYLFESRPNAGNLFGRSQIGNCMGGLIILPDGWTWTGDVAEFQARWVTGQYFINDDITQGDPSDVDGWAMSFTYLEWKKMEAAGAVFLPAAGYRTINAEYKHAGEEGGYWHSTCVNYEVAKSISIKKGKQTEGNTSLAKRYGYSVRLVSPVE